MRWPPPPPVWGLGAVAALLVLGLVVMLRPHHARPVLVAPVPAGDAVALPNGPVSVFVAPTPPAPAANAPAPENRPAEEPSVTVRTLPEPARNSPATNAPAVRSAFGNRPALGGSGPANGPVTTPPAGSTVPGNTAPGNTVVGSTIEGSAPPDVTQPAPAPDLPAEGGVAPARPRMREPLPAPERPATRPRRASTPTGAVSIYFDADSSTFDGHDRRLPLRVQVYVDGRKRLETENPEKRQFDLGRLPEGPHEVRIVPFVGDAPAETREETVQVLPDERNSYKAVLHRSHGISQVRRFKAEE